MASDAVSAQAHFSERYSCPENRLTVRSTTTSPTPPADIQSDPERLAIWRKSAEAQSVAYVIVSGCGTEQGYHSAAINHRIFLVPGMPPL